MIILFILLNLCVVDQNNFPDNLKWENRVILLFSGTEEDEMVRDQISTLKSVKEGLVERDLKVFIIGDNSVRTMEGRSVNNASASKLREKFRINSSSFTYILIGKDGGVKLREMFTVSNDRLFSLIDSMPMRRREMKDDQ